MKFHIFPPAGKSQRRKNLPRGLRGGGTEAVALPGTHSTRAGTEPLCFAPSRECTLGIVPRSSLSARKTAAFSAMTLAPWMENITLSRALCDKNKPLVRSSCLGCRWSTELFSGATCSAWFASRLASAALPARSIGTPTRPKLKKDSLGKSLEINDYKL